MKHETLNMKRDELLSPHFTLREFVVSQTAKEHGIVNVPSEQEIENLRALCVHTLEPIREALGMPIVVTSGYRTKALNDKLAHSSKCSQHMQGQAADFYVAKGPVSGVKSQVSGNHLELETGESPMKLETSSRRELLIKAFRQIITDESINFDQCIIYPSFIHVSYVRSGRTNRRKLTRGFSNGTYAAHTRAQALKLV